jgi:phosphatidylserine decarboxylase
MTQRTAGSHRSAAPRKAPRVEGSGKSVLTLDNAGPVQMGFWVPNRVWATSKYLVPLRDHVAAKKKGGKLAPLHSAVAELKQWVSSHGVYRMWVESMIDESNEFVRTLDAGTKKNIKDGDGDAVWIKDYDSLFEIISEIITTSPSFNNTAQVGTPMNGLLAVSMATRSGVALFHDGLFNLQLKKVLDALNAFLKSPASLDKLDISDPEKPGSWISKAAWKAGVWEQMEHDPSKPGYGFDSWNSFFIRRFVPGARPYQGDARRQVSIGCETTPWAYENDVALKTDFWVKDVNYSLIDLFGGREDIAKLFEGGQLYQGFLSATHYHRWQSPLDGTIERSWVQPGTYFAERPAQREGVGTWEGTESQPYLGHVAARAIFLFKHETCGYVALICMGMVEVSTCVIEPQYLVDGVLQSAPVKISRGVEIGHFEFGGSTHILVFQKDRVRLEEWARNAAKHRHDPKPTPLGSVIATAVDR